MRTDVKIFDWVPYISLDLHAQVRAQICSVVVDPKIKTKRFTKALVENWQDMDILTVLDVLIKSNAAALDDGNSL